MEQMALMEKQDYENFKEELKRKLDETSENFIVIGYILKQVRDRRLYLQENYSDIYGFGFGVYGLSKATVSRFMNINTKFSVGGSSREIKAEYKGYGRSKIQEMLNVDENDMELITADTTVDQVKELKKAESIQKQIEKEEQDNNLPLVRISAGDDPGSAAADQEPADPFEVLITAFWRENTELYQKVAAGLITPEIIAEEISPSGSMTYRDGVNIMFFYDIDKGLKLRSYAKGKAEITQYTYQELIQKTQDLDPIQDQERGKQEPPQKEPVAAPQPDPEEQNIPYIPVPGQTSVSDLYDLMSDAMRESDEEPEQDQDNTATDKNNVIDGEYRELAESTVQEDIKEPDTGTEECMYTDIEIRNAISFFDMEYSRMVMQQDTAKRRNYKIALECIRRCYKSVADNETGAGT